MAKSLCRACNKTFKSVVGFDMHRTGSYGEAIYSPTDKKQKNAIGYTKPSRRCLTTEEMLAIGMCLNDKELWITEAYDPNIKHKDDEEDTEQEEDELAEA